MHLTFCWQSMKLHTKLMSIKADFSALYLLPHKHFIPEPTGPFLSGKNATWTETLSSKIRPQSHPYISSTSPPPLLACRPLGQVETVSVIDLWATRLFTRHYLAPVTTAEALVFPLLCNFLLCLLLHGNLPLPFL